MTFVLCPHTKIGALILGIESVYDIHKIYHENICMDIYPLLYVLTVWLITSISYHVDNFPWKTLVKNLKEDWGEDLGSWTHISVNGFQMSISFQLQ